MPTEYNNFFYNIVNNILKKNNEENLIEHFSHFKDPQDSLIKKFKDNLSFFPIQSKLIEIYGEAKKITNILSRFVYRYKLKKAIKFDYNRDLFGNKLELYPDYQKIDFFQNNTIYTFRITDLINIISE